MFRVRFRGTEECFHGSIHEVVATTAMRVDINETGGNVVALRVDHPIICRRCYLFRFYYGCNFSLFAYDRKILFYFIGKITFPFCIIVRWLIIYIN